jgi:ABC-type antimicrobial peptide transport system permease subunit
MVSYGVAQRTNEFGIRIALGAQRKEVLRLVFGSATLSVGIGLVAGISLNFYAARLVARWTTVNASDPVIFLSATVLFVFAAVVACAVPAIRASSTDPMEALRRQ